jgi:hypothetical protein
MRPRPSRRVHRPSCHSGLAFPTVHGLASRRAIARRRCFWPLRSVFLSLPPTQLPEQSQVSVLHSVPAPFAGAWQATLCGRGCLRYPPARLLPQWRIGSAFRSSDKRRLGAGRRAIH